MPVRTRSYNRTATDGYIEHDTLHTLGYTVLRGKPAPQACVAEAMRGLSQGTNVFQSVGKGYRIQHELKASLHPSLSVVAADVEALIGKQHIVWSLLHSRAGCPAQPAHADYAPDLLQGVPDHLIPLGCLVSIMKGTRLTVWPGAFVGRPLRSCVYPETVELEVGDILLFRGDLVHAGSSYPDPNSRLHGFVDTVAVLHEPARRFQVTVHAESAFVDRIRPEEMHRD